MLTAGKSKEPFFIRARDGENIGTTGFFRNKPLTETLFALLENYEKSELSILFHSCSIGAEPYSLVIDKQLCKLPALQAKTLHCYATDISPGFVQYAKMGQYPASVLTEMDEKRQAFFSSLDAESVQLDDSIRSQVHFLEPASYIDFTSSTQFDVVFVMNSLLYVKAEEQAQTFDNIARYNTGYLVTTATHPDQMKADLTRNGYSPVITNMEAIYNAMGDRLNLAKNFLVPGKTEVTPSLDPFNVAKNSEDYEWKYSTIFQKDGY